MTANSSKLEIWGGIECTINRVGDRYQSQLEHNGHLTRLDDLDRFAGLGLKTLRYPILWEQLAPEHPDQIDWTWSDERMNRLRELGINSIAGLVHHGSGPRYTSLVDPNFPELLAQFARSVAARYPWIRDFTPVNEPLTTARFSGLYGLWYPHGYDDRIFAEALLNECRGTVLAMQAIREITPNARLVQTDDIGKTYSRPELAYQAEFENDRRWLTHDLLCARVTPEHPMWQWLTYIGIEEEKLTFFLQNPMPPDIIGVNHYLTSERFLDDRISLYPNETSGDNGRHRYVDVAAVRVLDEERLGPKGILREVWERYRIPMVVTEAHLGCTREEQMRWLHEIWTTAQELREEGVDLQAVTVWALLGLVDWDSLLTRFDGHYEVGAFDIRAPEPRPTALAKMVRSFAQTGDFQHPLLASSGWWKRRIRYLHAPLVHSAEMARIFRPQQSLESARPVIITGASSTLGRAFARICQHRGIHYYLLNRQEMDITSPDSVAASFEEIRPWAVINAAGFVSVDDAETDSEKCFHANVEGPLHLANACHRHGVEFVAFSSDLVFDGRKRTPYLESDTPNPLNEYGASKAEMESRLLALLPSALIVRTSAFYDPWDEHNFASATLASLASHAHFDASTDIVSPTYVPDLVQAVLDLLIDGEAGIWHLANDGAITWADFAKILAAESGFQSGLIRPRSSFELGWNAKRPHYSALGTERGKIMPSLANAVRRYVGERPLQTAQAAA